MKIGAGIHKHDRQVSGLKKYILKEYGSWGVVTLSYMTGIIVSSMVTPGAAAVFIAIALYINSKQAFVLWMRRREENTAQALFIFIAQVVTATVILLLVLGNRLFPLMPYAVVPLAYLLCLRFLGEHALLTEISGFVLLSLSSLVAKLTTSGAIDPALFIAVAVFFTAGVFKVRVQFKKGVEQRILMAVYIAFAFIVYRLLSVPALALLPLLDNLIFSFTLYRVKVRATGWLEVLKGVIFLLLMALSYR